MKILGHLHTINHHKLLVMKHCFRVGLYRQGLLHDLSKYSPTEFFVGCKYYQGTRSPNNAEREATGYSKAWLHHKGRNKHHYEYWIDYSLKTGRELAGMKMPPRYVAEMMMDRIAASRIYKGKDYDRHQPLVYYEQGKEAYVIHEETRELLEYLLHMLSEQGEKKTLAYIRRNLAGKKEYPNLMKKRGNQRRTQN